MFGSIRRYTVQEGAIDHLVRTVDEGFAEELQAQPGFVSYEFVDCGDGEVMTISVFQTAEAAAESREHARRWSDDWLGDFRLVRLRPLHGAILVSRASSGMLTPGHAGGTSKFASVRRYTLRRGEVAEVMHSVDESFADRIEALLGFAAYHALDCEHGEIVSISLLRDQGSAEESDDLALAFVRDNLSAVDIEGTEVIGGEVRVSRAATELLAPAHA
jgi:hypothetical protein